MYIDIQYLGEAAALRLSLWLVAGAALKQFFGFEPVIGEQWWINPMKWLGFWRMDPTWKIIPLSKWLVAVFFSPIDQWDNERIGDLRSSGLLTSGMILQVGIFHEIEDLINTYGDITGMYNSVDIYTVHIYVYISFGCACKWGIGPQWPSNTAIGKLRTKRQNLEVPLFSDKAISIDICNDVICIIDP